MNDQNQQRLTYPRVSDIIDKQNGDELRSVPLEVLAKACLRGIKVHEYCAAWMKNLWICPSDIEEEYQPYFNEFLRWAEVNVSNILHANVRLYDDVKRFTGEFDAIVRMKDTGETALIDIKTCCTRSKSWPIQLAAYHHLCKINGYGDHKIYNLHLKKQYSKKKEGEMSDISPTIIKAKLIDESKDVSSHWEIFSNALKCYDYFSRKEVA